MVRVKSSQDLWAGILFVTIGAVMFAAAYKLAQGTALRMGPGYVPRLLCGMLILVGAGLLVRGLTVDGETTGTWAVRPMIFVLGSILVFAYGLEHLGLVITTFLAVGFSSFAIKGIKPLELVIVAACMAAASTLLFVYGLKLIIPVWPQF